MDPELEQGHIAEGNDETFDPLSDKEKELIGWEIDLKSCEQWYMSNPNNYRMLELWSRLHAYGVNVPNWLQEKVDAYLLAQLRNESKRYKKSNITRSLKTAFEIVEAENKAVRNGSSKSAACAAAIKKIAQREGISERAVRSRISRKRKKI